MENNPCLHGNKVRERCNPLRINDAECGAL